MREILFRGKNLLGKWIEGDLLQYLGCEKKHIVRHSTGAGGQEVIHSTIGEYTGLKDKNGKRIFEGDIVTMPRYGSGKHKSVVYFKNGKFAVNGSNYNFKDICPRNMEVIGNIYDNPEFLGGVNNG